MSLDDDDSPDKFKDEEIQRGILKKPKREDFDILDVMSIFSGSILHHSEAKVGVSDRQNLLQDTPRGARGGRPVRKVRFLKSNKIIQVES